MILFLQGKPLFVYALQKFVDMPCVSTVVLVSDNPQRMMGIVINYKLPNAHKIHCVEGGASRHRSIKLGLKALSDALGRLTF